MHLLLAATMGLLLMAAAAPAAAPSDRVSSLDWDVVSRRAHDDAAFTQGLQLDASGRLFESTGLRGRSTLREVDPVTGAVLRSVALPDEIFAEGLALVDDRLIQLTWRNGLAVVWSVEDFAPVEAYEYEGEGWGLCHDGRRLVMSDGSSRLTFRDPETFVALGDVEVTLDGEPLVRLNELECVDGVVWANVWETDRIVRIDPLDGRVTGVLDMAGLLQPHPAAGDDVAVLNGIAYDADADTFLVTGKLWPELVEIRVSDPG